MNALCICYALNLKLPNWGELVVCDSTYYCFVIKMLFSKSYLSFTDTILDSLQTKSIRLAPFIIKENE